MKKHLLPAIIFMILFACSNSSDKDLSLTAKEYQEMGLPDPASTWNFEDYKEACIVLNNIKANKPFSLPRKDSKRSGDIFSRITNPENLVFVQDESLTLNERAFRIQHYVDIQGCFVTVYTESDISAQYYHRELIDLYIFGLTIAQEMLDLGQLINESVEEEALEMQYAYHSIRLLYLTMVMFILENQQKSWFFGEEDLVRLSDFLANSVMINREWIEDEPAREIKIRLNKIIEHSESDEIREKYIELAENLS
jgi:hypothetical protein